MASRFSPRKKSAHLTLLIAIAAIAWAAALSAAEKESRQPNIVFLLAGIAIPATVEGRSLVPVLTGKADTLYPQVFGYFRDVQRMVRTDRYKLIEYPKIGKRQLFDLAADSAEMHDLAEDRRHAQVVADLGRTLHEGLANAGL